MKQLISLIIPCYNEEESLMILYDEIQKVARILSNFDMEYIFVDDGSKDKTLQILREIAQRDKKAKYLSFSRNFGKESAMYAGFCNASGDYVAVLDADMQDPPSLLPEMINILQSDEYDSVATRRVTRKGEPAVRSFFARMFYKIINRISDADIVDGARDFRLMKRSMVDAIVSMSEHSRFSKGIFGWVGFRTYWLAFENVERVAGITKWTFWKMLKYSIVGIVNFSDTPVSLLPMAGIMFVAATIITAVVFGISGGFVNPWEIIIPIILAVCGIQLIALGIVGKYLTTVNAEVKKRPHYIIAHTNDDNAERIK